MAGIDHQQSQLQQLQYAVKGPKGATTSFAQTLPQDDVV
jgi:hypothetical protein